MENQDTDLVNYLIQNADLIWLESEDQISSLAPNYYSHYIQRMEFSFRLQEFAAKNLTSITKEHLNCVIREISGDQDSVFTLPKTFSSIKEMLETSQNVILEYLIEYK